MRVIGTAGHVDHGKSTLVRRLTGIDPDRLAEEKAREMTIDLGFAWLKLADNQLVGIVDVPGHRDFIENMLAGVGGIDAVLMVIAADEGVMPQTREHLAILDLLGLKNGLIVLTKIDMVDDPDWLDLVEQEVRDALATSSLADAPLLRVSAHTGAGIPELVQAIQTMLTDLPERPDINQPRLPVDRVFTMSGFGTVVTGTLTGGALHVGDEVEILPQNLRARVRGLQSYKQSVDTAYPGSRTAVNLSGIERSALQRGSTLAKVGVMRPTLLMDAQFRLLADAARPLKHNTIVKVFSGTQESQGFVRLLNDETLTPGQEGWIQIRLDEPMAVMQGDRYILRIPSPAETIGGGFVVNPYPERRWKRFQPQVIQDLQTRLEGSPTQRLTQVALGREPLTLGALAKATGLPSAQVQTVLRDAIDEGLMTALNDELYIATATYNALRRELYTIVERFHEENPLRGGMPREELRSRVGMKQNTFTLITAQEPGLVSAGSLIRTVTHTVQFTPRQQQNIERLRAMFTAAPYTPPSFADSAAIVSEDVLRALIDLGEFVLVQPDVLFDAHTYAELVRGTLALIDADGTVSAKSLRDKFNTSRKYAIGLLEYLDSLGITRRVGDDRVRGKNAPSA